MAGHIRTSIPPLLDCKKQEVRAKEKTWKPAVEFLALGSNRAIVTTGSC